MCEWGTYKIIEINGRFWKVDACIADTVQLLISRGVKTWGCCCGHGNSPIPEGIWHNFGSELMISADSKTIVENMGLETSVRYEKTTWGVTRNYANVKLNKLNGYFDENEIY